MVDKQKIIISIRSSLVASLIGKSQYNKDYESFIKLLHMNKYNLFHDKDEFDNILPTNDKDIDCILNTKYNNIIELQDKLTELQTMNLSTNVLDHCKKYIICSFGKQKEYDVLKYYLESKDIKFVKSTKQFISNTIFKSKYFDIYLTGTPDYISYNNEIIEIKNRVHTFSKQIKECDYIQLQLYLNMYGVDDGRLVEGMVYPNDKIEINEFKVKRDEYTFEIIKQSLIKICILQYYLLTDEKLFQLFNTKNNIEKSNFIVNNLDEISLCLK